MSTEPTIIIVPGMFHPPKSYSPLQQALSTTHTVTTVPTANVGAVPLTTSIDADIQSIRTVLHEHIVDKKSDVVVVMHSYGGMPGTAACEGFSKKEREGKGEKGGVVKLVYMTSFVPWKGDSLPGLAKRGEEDGMVWLQLLDLETVPSGKLMVRDPAEAFYNDVAPDLVKSNVELVTYSSKGVWTGEVQYEAWRDIPSLYIVCTLDKAITQVCQEWMYEKAKAKGGEWEVVHVESGHSPWLSKLDWTATQIRKAAGGNI